MAPEPAVHAGKKEDDESEGCRQRQIDRDESEVITDPLRVLEPHQKRKKGRRDYREEVSDEQVPVSNWLERQNVFLEGCSSIILKKTGPTSTAGCWWAKVMPCAIYTLRTSAQSGCHTLVRTYGHRHASF